MKVISTDNIASVTASEEDANFPASNLLTDFRTQLWKGSTAVEYPGWETGVEWESGVAWELMEGETTLPYIEMLVTGVEYGKTMALGIFNTNATKVYVTVTRSNGTEAMSAEAYFTESDPDITDLWIDYEAQTDTHTIKIEFLPPAGFVAQAGKMCAGESLSFINPKYGLNENLDDKSIKKILNSGATYYKKRNIIRQFSGSIEVQRDDKFYEFMYSVIRDNGSIPLAWLLADDLQDRRWTVYGRPDMPSGSHDYYSHSNISFKIEEGL